MPSTLDLSQIGLLPPLGTFTYNGVTFGAFTRSEIHSTCVWSTDQRTIIYVVYSIDVRATVVYPNIIAQEANMAQLRQLLQSPAGPLVISGRGFGGLNVNTTGTSAPQDVVWGPKPRLIHWKPKGGNLAAEVHWVCEVAIPECSNAVYNNALMEVNTKYHFSIDRSGYTRLSYSGFIRIPNTRVTQSDRNLFISADDFREQAVPLPPPEMGIESQDYDLADDKSRLDYSIVYYELPPNAPPPGVIEISASHSVESTTWGIRWLGKMSATYELQRNVPRALALQYFAQLFQSRAALTVQNAQGDGGQGFGPGVVIPVAVYIGEPEIHGRKAATFSISYTFATSLQTILLASGLFTKPPNSDATAWQASLLGNAFSPRGNAQFHFNVTTDKIVDLCNTSPPTLGMTNTLTAGTVGTTSLFANTYPDPNDSYLDYKIHTMVEEESGTCVLKTLPAGLNITPNLNSLTTLPLDSDNSQGDQNTLFTDGARIQNFTGSYQSPYQAGLPTAQIQNRTAPTLRVTQMGYGIRAGYDITPPVITSVNGIQTIPANREGIEFYRHGMIGSWFGVPIIGASWRQSYILPNVPPGQLGLAPNPNI